MYCGFNQCKAQPASIKHHISSVIAAYALRERRQNPCAFGHFYSVYMQKCGLQIQSQDKQGYLASLSLEQIPQDLNVRESLKQHL